MQATGTVQRRSVRAPQTTIEIANGSLTRNGMGTAAHVPSRPATWVRTPIQSTHAHGMIAADVATTMTVAPSAIARLRHSRRTANQISPIPGETLVSRMSAQAAGQRKPSDDRDRQQQRDVAAGQLGRSEQDPDDEQPRAGQEADGEQQHRGPDADEGEPGQVLERRDDLEEGGRIDVGAGRRPVGLRVRRVEARRPVRERLLAGPPRPDVRLGQHDDREPQGSGHDQPDGRCARQA